MFVLAVIAGCGNNKTESKPVEPQTAVAVVKPQPPPEKPAPAQLIKSFQRCSDAWSAQRWGELEACFSATAVADAPGTGLPETKGNAAIVESLKPFRLAFPDASAKPELVLASGNRLIAIVHVLGKHGATWKVDGTEIGPTHRQTSSYLAQVLEYDDKGKISRRSDYFDLATLVGQIKPSKHHDVRGAMDQPFMVEQAVIAADEAREKTMVATVNQFVARFTKHDTTVGELLADDLKWSEQPLPKDLDRKGAIARISELWKTYTDSKLTLDGSLGAGEFVAAFETLEGTHKGKKVSVPMLAIYRLEHDKIAAVWTFYQSSASSP